MSNDPIKNTVFVDRTPGMAEVQGGKQDFGGPGTPETADDRWWWWWWRWREGG